jgi:hypothetical protein
MTEWAKIEAEISYSRRTYWRAVVTKGAFGLFEPKPKVLFTDFDFVAFHIEPVTLNCLVHLFRFHLARKKASINTVFLGSVSCMAARLETNFIRIE